MQNINARYKCKKHIRFNFTEDDILTTMGCHIMMIKSWSVSLGDKKNTPILECLGEGIVAASSGDKVLLELLGLNYIPPNDVGHHQKVTTRKHSEGLPYQSRGDLCCSPQDWRCISRENQFPHHALHQVDSNGSLRNKATWDLHQPT